MNSSGKCVIGMLEEPEADAIPAARQANGAEGNGQEIDDLLWRQLKTIPAFRALLRAVEARFYQVVDLPDPVLDVGCGDGHFATMTFNRRLSAGADPWWGPLQKARESRTYDLPLQAAGDLLPYPNHTFNSAFSNSVLEHIPDIQPVLDEVSRVMKPGAPFVLTMPSHLFTEYLAGAGFFERMGLEGMAGRYRSFFNRISRHAHTDSPELWAERLAQAGFVVERWQYYFSKDALRALEVGHVQGLPSAALHGLTGHWIIGPWRSNLRYTERWLRPHYEEPFPAEGAYIFMLARKMADDALKVSLPPAQPFTHEELARETELQQAPAREIQTADVVAAPSIMGEELAEIPADSGEVAEDEARPMRSRSLIMLGLAILALLFAVFGQSGLRSAPESPAEGLRWLLYSGLAIGLLIWLGRDSSTQKRSARRLPSLKNINRRRWLIFPAFILAILARSFSNPAGEVRPSLAILAWIAAAGLAVLALYSAQSEPEDDSAPAFKVDKVTWIASLIFFVVSLVLRLYQLGEHPFILNGTEASLGLDALAIAQGNARAPFGTGWLTNPTLSLYALSIPLWLFGPSIFALRLLSAFAGALTVTATFLFGQRLYGRIAGTTAAILLLGSHFHLHYSRLGLTNVWDGLLILLTLGLLAVAWDRGTQSGNWLWLGAGVAAGLSTYLFTSSRLLPLILLALLVLMLIFQRRKLRSNLRNLFAAALLALVIALPQLLFYRSSPEIFWERFQALSVLDEQTGWVRDEAARIGTSQWQVWQQQISRSLLAFNAIADSGSSYGALQPLLNFFAGIFFLLGGIVATLRLNRLKYGILIIWVAATMFVGGVLLLEPPNSHRLIIAAPAVNLLAGIGLAFVLDALLGRRQRSQASAMPENRRRLSIATIVLIAAIAIASVIALLDVRYYFGPYRTEHHFGDRNTEIANEMATYLNSLDGDWDAYFYGPPSMYIGFPTIPFLAQDFEADRNMFDVFNPGDPLPQAAAPNKVHIYLPERLDELGTIQGAFPAGEQKAFSGYYGDPLFVAYEIRN